MQGSIFENNLLHKYRKRSKIIYWIHPRTLCKQATCTELPQTIFRLILTDEAFAKNAFPSITVHLKTVTNKEDKWAMLFALKETGEAKIHILSHPKEKIGHSSLAEVTRSPARVYVMPRCCHGVRLRQARRKLELPAARSRLSAAAHLWSFRAAAVAPSLRATCLLKPPVLLEFRHQGLPPMPPVMRFTNALHCWRLPLYKRGCSYC
jgi:hypothetical protein